MQDDITDGVLHMISKGYVDSGRVCIVGGSYGGYAALMGVAKTPSLFRCAVSVNGISHLGEMVEHDEDRLDDEELVSRLVYSRIGHPDKDEAMLLERSPALLAAKIQAEVLIIAGEEDEIVPVEQSELMVEALDDHDKDYEYIELEDTGHYAINYRESADKIYAALERFLAKHLSGRDAAQAREQP